MSVQRFTQENQAQNSAWSRFKRAIRTDAFKNAVAVLVPAVVVFALGRSMSQSDIRVLVETGLLTSAGIAESLVENTYWVDNLGYLQSVVDFLKANSTAILEITHAHLGVRRRKRKSGKKSKKSKSKRSVRKSKSKSKRSVRK
jgi:hypothetical protein